MAQHKVFEDKRAFATRERSAAGAACDLCLSGLRSRFDLDHVLARLAVRTRKGNERMWPAVSHSMPPNTQTKSGGVAASKGEKVC